MEEALSVPFRELDDKVYDIYGYRKPTQAEYQRFNRAVDNLPPDIKKLWTSNRDTILAIDPEKHAYAKCQGNWIIIGKNETESIMQHEFIHRTVHQGGIYDELGRYKPGDTKWLHATDDTSNITDMLDEDLTMTLSHYKSNIDEWADDMVKNGDFLQGHKYITGEQATDKALRVIKFFTGLGLW